MVLVVNGGIRLFTFFLESICKPVTGFKQILFNNIWLFVMVSQVWHFDKRLNEPEIDSFLYQLNPRQSSSILR